MGRKDVAIIDGGGANIASLKYALERLGADSYLTSVADEIRSASHVILPGVGAAAAAMAKLNEHGLTSLVHELTQPLLGICLGMQLLCAGSEEDHATCIGVFGDQALKLRASPASPVPNMGWCRIARTQESPLLDGIDDGSWFYFVHSYAVPVSGHTLATARHTGEFAAIIGRDNFFATQFHPERSSHAGARLLANFLDMGQ
ncbi:MAG: imidazole glycerol phosphate synthase subunit HisH [Gammaproteobacteria bacterium]|nr:imidazole glycerol phosphate synthase subunit HisH [Gammaproteobacteria bacterium]